MILVIAMFAAQAAAAETPNEANSGEMICRSVATIGSRLARQRRCATRAQWEEQARNERRSTEDAQIGQTQPTNLTPGERRMATGQYVAAPGRGTPRN